ncbi:hypothetical protein E2C01_091187 [Portunus trituberculatus]|uniref:Uncharacterized protein n=1 Tax=Portunus trituberculatus TaxID=210409 RepID=A0A5B7JS38_PORTR|nr:hypothetical protein [Portunus trituberculatus]
MPIHSYPPPTHSCFLPPTFFPLQTSTRPSLHSWNRHNKTSPRQITLKRYHANEGVATSYISYYATLSFSSTSERVFLSSYFTSAGFHKNLKGNAKPRSRSLIPLPGFRECELRKVSKF